MVGCMPLGGTQQGGRRRRGKGKGKTRKMRGGNFYGFNGGVGGTTAGADWKPVVNAEVNPQTGAVVPESILPKTGGRRRGKGKKSRKGRKGRKGRKTMRGGANWVSVAPAGGSYTGQGAGGLINLTQYGAKMPVAGGPVQGGDGVYQTS